MSRAFTPREVRACDPGMRGFFALFGRKPDEYHVHRSAEGTAWVVRKYGSTRALKRFARKLDAYRWAKTRALSTGGRIVLHYLDGRVQA